MPALPPPAGPDVRTGRAPSRWPLALLTASLGLVILATVVAGLSTRKHGATTVQLLRDYAAFAAWSYSQRIAEDLGEGAWFTLNPIQHSAPHRQREMPAASDLVGYRAGNLDRCRCDGGVSPSSYFRFRLGSDTVETAGAPLAGTDHAALLRDLPAVLRRKGIRVPPTGFVALAPDGLAAYGLMPTEWGDTMVYGFTVDRAALSATFTRVLRENSLLPAAVTRGARNEELLLLEVADTGGRVLYRDADWPADPRDWPYAAVESLPAFRGGLVARLAVRPAAAATHLAGGFPWSPVPLLILVGLLGIGTAVVAVAQLRREGELARVRSDFVASVSHELRTPLAQIRLFLDTLRLKRYDTPAEAEWLVGHLSRETTRLEHLVENVLSVTRLERGPGAELRQERLSLDREVAESLLAFQPLAASRHVTLAADLADDVAIDGDRGAVRQLLLNLLDNAVKFGPPGQTVRVSLTRGPAGARLSVRDAGPGVPDAERRRIWEPYVRGGGATTAAVGGSGIGLAVVQDLARRMGGAVAVGSAPGGGAEFSVTLPLAGGNGGSG
ncbi:MAG TPA: HAMP domain-containing sensor histidine kinase [Gemmatimonadales bacterium]|nr:HAMP domain-containing sensor histidine kinase [Gemmatimonadales bacterium]